MACVARLALKRAQSNRLLPIGLDWPFVLRVLGTLWGGMLRNLEHADASSGPRKFLNVDINPLNRFGFLQEPGHLEAA